MYTSVEAIRAANERAGKYFFEPDTMRFFSSRILSGVEHGRYFVTSETDTFSGTARRYTIREATENGDVETVGSFCAFETAREARRAMRDLPPEGFKDWAARKDWTYE